ncbi:Crp/Fnr family transcriptional regulator [Camelimonas abortus]|uniref:Crp/Fnr family transcriptional regulator n=1 Tax=Camelimonas abortus TaxID=1017184 RepID=A0ABV7LCS8_9HYPH
MSLDHDAETIARAPELAGFEADALRLIAFAAPRRTFPAGARIFSFGEPAQGALLVARGRIMLTQPGESGPDLAVSAGAVIDDMAMFVGTVRAADATAVEDTDVIILDRAIIRRVLTEFPRSAAAVRDAVSARLNRMSAELAGVGRKLAALDQPPE